MPSRRTELFKAYGRTQRQLFFRVPYCSLRQINSTKPGSLQTIIRSFKGACTKGARFHHLADRVWQRGYHEHIIRKEASLMKIRQYIRDNPTKWQRDELFVHDTGHGNVISLSLR
jgi:REP element-mobilizing transposase RayT